MDDFADNISTTGRYSVLGAPILIRSDFVRDQDWIRVSGFERYTSYNLLSYPDPDLPSASNSQYDFYDTDGEFFTTAFAQSFPNTTVYYHAAETGDVFVGFGTNFRSTPGYFNFFARAVDVNGDTFAEATELRLNQNLGHGGALIDVNDVDWFTYELRGGITYTLNLHGASSFGSLESTLGDPILRVFDSSGQFLRGDNNSGTGTDSRLVFTPTVDGTYYLRVSGDQGTTGSYLLQSDQLDDFGSLDPGRGRFLDSTIGQIVVDAPAASGRSDHAFDEDALRVTLKQGFDYRIVSSGSSLRLFDPQLEPIDFINEDDFLFTAEQPGDHVLQASMISPDGFSVQVITTDLIGQTNNTTRPVNAPLVTSAIETPGDRDRFRVGLLEHGLYHILVEGFGDSPLSNPGFALRDQDGGFILNSTGNQTIFQVENDGDSEFVFAGNLHHIDVRSNDPAATGSYGVRVTPLDRTPGDTSTLWTAGFVNGDATIQNALEFSGDVDFHRVNFQANTWYRFESRMVVDVVAPDGSSLSLRTGSEPDYYFAQEAGEYYAVVGEEDSFGVGGSYQIDIFEGDKPPNQSGTFREPHENRPPFFNPRSLDGQVEVVSAVGYTVQRAGTRVAIAPEQATLHSFEEAQTILPLDDLNGTSELFFRPVGPTGNVLPWSAVDFVGQPSSVEDIRGTIDYRSIQYAFADGLPSYLAGDPQFSSFVALDAGERTRFNEAAASWTTAGLGTRTREAAPGIGNDAAPITVFKAALGAAEPAVVAFAPGGGIGGDIILNTDSSITSDLTPGGQGYFELIRAIGIANSLRETDSVSITESVLGNRNAADFEGPYPSTPLPLDIAAGTLNFDEQLNTANFQGDTVYSLVATEPFFRLIADGTLDDSERDSISNFGSSLSSDIDLRPGNISYVVGTDTPQFAYVNSYFSRIRDAEGGDVADSLIGNALDNVLSGHGGNDILVGGVGDDLLQGGVGNDFYKFRPGYGDETIDEQGLGGTDTLRVEGLFDTGFLQDDLTFERLGNDLIVRLELGGEPDRVGDSITIRNMSDPQSRIETLTLLGRDGAATAHISLQSAFDQATDQRQRFRVVAASDSFGNFVTPV